MVGMKETSAQVVHAVGVVIFEATLKAKVNHPQKTAEKQCWNHASATKLRRNDTMTPLKTASDNDVEKTNNGSSFESNLQKRQQQRRPASQSTTSQ